MKLLVVVLVVLAIVYALISISGCTEQIKTIPWSEEEIEKLGDYDINTVPIAFYEF